MVRCPFGEIADLVARTDTRMADQGIVELFDSEYRQVQVDEAIDAEVLVNAEAVGNEADLVARRCAQPRIILDLTLLRSEYSGDQAQQGAFAYTIDASNQADLAGRHLKIEMAEDRFFIVAKLQVSNG